MKIAQTECETQAAAIQKQHSPTATVITTNTSAAVSFASAEVTTSASGIDENVAQSNNAGAATKATTTMTDERNSTNNGSSSSSNNTNERIIAEAAKILLKNGLNGTNPAAAAALLTAATFQPPAPPQPPTTTTTATRGSVFNSPPAHAEIITTTGTAVSEGSASAPQNNGLLSSPTPAQTKATTKTMATAAATSTVSHLGVGTPPATHFSSSNVKSEIGGVLDYTVNTNSPSSTSLILKNSSHRFHSGNNSNDIGRNPISVGSGNSGSGNGNANACGGGIGGRLQFFKDGKFILELARSKDGEKSGWVSVPRKLFRSPSATSSTVTPTSATATAFPKNESSTSLSFSDDNSSIQSSPWQRDHCWKQTTPRRKISKEMSLYFRRPKDMLLTASGLEAARKKYRRPYDVTKEGENFFKKDEKRSSGVDGNVTLKPEELPATLIKKEKEYEEPSDVESIKTATKVKEESCAPDDRKDVGEAETSSHPHLSIKQEVEDEIQDTTLVEKMNTSDDDEALSPSIVMAEVNGEHVEKEEKKPEITAKTSLENKTEERVVDKRLKKLKTRAKLAAIVHTLTERASTRAAQLSKTTLQASGNSGGATVNSSNVLQHKISPPSSSIAASRLVDHHQQHVSPRKRILRELEKVSLDDNAAVAGGKRSRAKASMGGNVVTSQNCTVKPSPNRLQPPATSSHMYTSNGNSHITATTSKAKSAATTAAPTRLYSSYSIHSLLGGSNSSSSSTNTKKSSDQAVISNLSYHTQQLQHYADPSYLRAMLASPKSPDGGNYSGGGKSPSNSGSKKRSPPYMSPMHDAHSRSPTVSHTSIDGGRRSPRATPPESNAPATSYKMRFSAEHSASPTSLQSPSHHLQQHQNFYSPYMMSPKYVPAPSTSISPNASHTGIPLSPRHSSISNAGSPVAVASTHIPNTSGSAQRELSPPRSLTASPRESTPRTVPKKTASIRRQFASPTASTTSSCPSPNERQGEDMSSTPQATGQPDHKTSISAAQLLQRGSPSINSVGGALPSPFHYYMYPPTANGAQNPLSSNNANAAATAAALYIPSVVSPSYYHPYISTLAALRQNPMWMHHYHGAPPPVLPPHHAASAASTPAARLSPSFQSLQYNGATAAAVMAAAAAAAFGNPQQGMSPMNHPHHHLMSSPSVMHGGLSMMNERRPSPKLTDTIDLPTYAKSSTSSTASAVTNATFTSNARDEHSSDLPLNLSKH